MKKSRLSNAELLVNEWFERANDDYRSAEAILKNHEGAPSTVCFLAQQMAEKYLKGYLVYKEKAFPRIHHLDRLVDRCQRFDSSFRKIKKIALELSDYYVTTRYPGDYPVFDFITAKKALKQAVSIKDFVFDKIIFSGENSPERAGKL